eukprot:SAG11_NODE_1728_length_4367_cov_4.915183_3_plen_63_part_00
MLHMTFLLLFGLGRTPQQSMLAYCGVTATQCIYGSGHIPNCALAVLPQTDATARRRSWLLRS